MFSFRQLRAVWSEASKPKKQVFFIPSSPHTYVHESLAAPGPSTLGGLVGCPVILERVLAPALFTVSLLASNKPGEKKLIVVI